MARRRLLSEEVWTTLTASPSDHRDVIKHCALTSDELDAVALKRTVASRLGYAVLLVYLRHPGRAPEPGERPSAALLSCLAAQVDANITDFDHYTSRPQTRREHLSEIMARFGYRAFSRRLVRELIEWLTPTAQQDRRPDRLAATLIEELRQRRLLIPTRRTVEMIVHYARRRAERVAHLALTRDLTPAQHTALAGLVASMADGGPSVLSWLKSPPVSASAKSLTAVIERLDIVRSLALPAGLRRAISAPEMERLAGEGLRTTVQHLRELSQPRADATLTAVALRFEERLTDAALDMFDKLLGKAIRQAERRTADSAVETLRNITEPLALINGLYRDILSAREEGANIAALLDARSDWHRLAKASAILDAVVRPDRTDFRKELVERYRSARRFSPLVLKSFRFEGAPAAASLLRAIALMRDLYAGERKSLPHKPPVAFVRKVWRPFVFPEPGRIDRRAWELCALFELRDRLRAGDVWVEGSRKRRSFDDRLIPKATFEVLMSEGSLPVAAPTDVDAYLGARREKITTDLRHVAELARASALPAAAIRDGVLSISPIRSETPDEARDLGRAAYGLLPNIKIPDLLTEVNAWTGFAECFSHYRTRLPAENPKALFAALLADGVNLGVSRMAEACQDLSFRQIAWAHDWHLREETFVDGLAWLIDAQRALPLALARIWGDGITSSSDGQYFRAGGRAEAASEINARYGTEPGVKFYTHISDQFGPFHTTVIAASASEAPHVLDGLLRHQSGLVIDEHYVDTGGATDHVFALCYLLGFRFAPRLRNFKDRRIYLLPGMSTPDELTPLVGGAVKEQAIRENWLEVLRLATSIRAGTATASSMLASLSAYPRQNGLAVALREIGRIERTLFALEWMRSLDLRQRTNAGLNKGEARNALARAVFFNRLGEMRDRSFENQLYRASGLNLLVAAIILWNTRYLEAALVELRRRRTATPDELVKHIAPLGWEHIGLTGDYVWNLQTLQAPDELRPLRSHANAWAA